MESCAHPFFDELRQPGARMPTGKEFPPLFNFTPQGKFGNHKASLYLCAVSPWLMFLPPLELSLCPSLTSVLIPPHCKQQESNLGGMSSHDHTSNSTPSEASATLSIPPDPMNQ